MESARAEMLLARINAVVKREVRAMPAIPRIHELVARALAKPMTITPEEVQELARAIIMFFPVPVSHAADVSDLGPLI